MDPAEYPAEYPRLASAEYPAEYPLPVDPAEYPASIEPERLVSIRQWIPPVAARQSGFAQCPKGPMGIWGRSL